jgi:N-methylhydantoinase A
VRGAIAAGAAVGLSELLTVDMGWTSTDVCLVSDGKAGLTTEYKIGGLPLGIPMYDIVTVGAGGGSIASIDPGGGLQVGPESAGALPGPASYGHGGERFTVTDANLMLGLLRPERFFGGKMPLAVEAAERAAQPLAERLGVDIATLADGVVRVANAIMAQAMRIVSIERGHDPRDYTIVAYGGAGPLHALALAEELGITRVLIPFDPGLTSAVGLTLADTRQDYLQTRIMPLASYDEGAARGLFAELRERAVRDFAAFGIEADRIRMQYALDLRFEGQAYELGVDVDLDDPQALTATSLAAAFRQVHVARYGHAPASANVEIVDFRLLANHPSGLTRLTNVPPPRSDSEPEQASVTVDGVLTRCPFYQRSALDIGASVSGPAVIEEPTATTFIRPGWRATVDLNLNLHIVTIGA